MMISNIVSSHDTLLARASYEVCSVPGRFYYPRYENCVSPGTECFWGRGEVFFVRDARRACRGATCRTACWDFRVPFHAMVGVVVGV